MRDLTRRAEAVIDHILAMRKHAKEIRAYCTDDCIECPLRGFCDWDGNIDYMDEGLESIERIADFINKADKKDAEEEDRQFKDATGYDPMEWDMLSRKE